jgi:CubicO group peptidase (beta-lactamase class C family)
MVDFFPELTNQIADPRKKQITIRQMLQMRAGYPWEESASGLFEALYAGFRPSLAVDFPLTSDPGTQFDYSNLTSHLPGIIGARACDTDLKSYAQENLFSQINVQAGSWTQDWEDYYLGYAELHPTARDMAKFGLLYLNDGKHDGNQIIPADWVHDSLQAYSEDAWYYKVGRNFRDTGCGYQW